MTNYQAGTRFEHRVRDRLRARGFEVVRSAGSKTGVDLVAIGHQRVWLVQCKRNGVLGSVEWNRLRRLADEGGNGCLPVLAMPRFLDKPTTEVTMWWLHADKVARKGFDKQDVQIIDWPWYPIPPEQDAT